MASLLPSHPGLLPYFLLYTGAAAIIHSFVTYLSPPSTSMKQFSGSSAPTPTLLLAHVYGVKNVYTCLMRMFAAYHITNAQCYQLAMATFVGVLVLNGGELFVWKTARLNEAMFPLLTAGSGLVWMWAQYGWYLA